MPSNGTHSLLDLLDYKKDGDSLLDYSIVFTLTIITCRIMAEPVTPSLCENCGSRLSGPDVLVCDHCRVPTARQCASCSQHTIPKGKRTCEACGHTQYKECLLCQTEILSSADQCHVCHAPQQREIFQYIPLKECLNGDCRTQLIPYLPTCYKCNTSQQLVPQQHSPTQDRPSTSESNKQPSVIESTTTTTTTTTTTSCTNTITAVSDIEDMDTSREEGDDRTNSRLKRGPISDVTKSSKRAKGESDDNSTSVDASTEDSCKDGQAIITLSAGGGNVSSASLAVAGQKRKSSPLSPPDIALKIMHESTDSDIRGDQDSGGSSAIAAQNNL